MTAPVVDAPVRPVRRPLLSAAAAEWTRLWTVRSTWACLASAALVVIGLGWLLGLDVAGEPPPEPLPPAHVAGELATLPGQFALLALVALAVTGEYANGVITTTLQWTPRRARLLAVRTVVPVLVATVAGTLLALAATLSAWAAAPDLGLTTGGLVGSLAAVAGVVAGGSLLTLGLGLLTRSTAATLGLVFLLMLVLPLVLPSFPSDLLETVGTHLPGAAAIYLLDGEVSGLTTTSAALVLTGWAAAAVAAGAATLLRRDADG